MRAIERRSLRILCSIQQHLPSGGYIAGPYDTPLSAIDDPGCRTPRISTSTNPIYAGQPVTFTDFFTGSHKRRWNMGSGATFANSSISLTYTYSTPGSCVVSLETKDASGARAYLTRVDHRYQSVASAQSTVSRQASS